MVLAKIIGTVLSTAKVPSLSGKTFVLCRPVESADEGDSWQTSESGTFVAVDLVGAPEGSVVMINTGSSAKEMSGAPVDAVVSGIVDYAVVSGKRVAVE